MITAWFESFFGAMLGDAILFAMFFGSLCVIVAIVATSVAYLCDRIMHL